MNISSGLETFPLLLPQDSKLSQFKGYVSVQGQEFPICITVPNQAIRIRGIEQKSMENATIEVNSDLKELLKGSEQTIQKRLAQSRDIPTFLNEFKDILDRALKTKKTEEPPPPTYYSRLIAEMDSIGWNKLVRIDTTMTELEFLLQDSHLREHTFKLKLPVDYPQSPPECVADLPAQVPIPWIPNRSSLLDILNLHQQAFEQYNDLWTILNDLDKNTWILEPEHPNYASVMRRIALGNHCSLQIHVDYTRPRAIPECQFLGADTIIGPLRDHFNIHLKKWDIRKTLRENLELTLGIQFPSPKSSRKEEFSEECGICYSYRLNDKDIPERVCENQKCGKPFHKICLFEWLRAIPTCRQSFGTLFGECPYCSSPITVKL